MEIGVREFKQHLSKYLDQVEAGAELVITDRGRPKARISPATDAGRIQQGVEQGWIRPPATTRIIGAASRHRSSRRTATVLDDDRA